MTVEAVSVQNKMKLDRVRAQLQLTQEQLADRANVSRRVVIRAENGQAIRLITAYAILNALNTLRTGQPPLDIDDLDWNVEA